jgi:hypothetical protein
MTDRGRQTVLACRAENFPNADIARDKKLEREGGGMTNAIRGSLLAIFAATLCTASAVAWSADPTEYYVIAVDGKTVVLQEQSGAAKQYTLPADFQLTVDGKNVALAELAPGMHGTATIAASTEARPVHVTTVKMGTVVSQTGRSVTFKEESGATHRFTQSEADERGMEIYIDNKPVRVSSLKPGDQINATVVSVGTPEILTAQSLDESLAAAGEAAKSGEAGTEAATAAQAPAAPAVAAPAPAEEKPSATTKQTWFWVLLVVIAAILVWMLVGNRKKATPKKKAA